MSVLTQSNPEDHTFPAEAENCAEDRIQDSSGAKIWLHVPYSCKNKCRFYGGKWDKHNKKWYFINDDIDVDREELMQWKEEPKKIYWRISYDRRERAKDLGLHFDKDKKKWFYYEGEEIDIIELNKIQKW